MRDLPSLRDSGAQEVPLLARGGYSGHYIKFSKLLLLRTISYNNTRAETLARKQPNATPRKKPAKRRRIQATIAPKEGGWKVIRT